MGSFSFILYDSKVLWYAISGYECNVIISRDCKNRFRNNMEELKMEKIKWGVLGTAGIAKGCTIPGMQLAENCELYAIAGRSKEKAEQFKDEFGFEVAYDNYEALLADENVKAVYIPLPNELHCEWVLKAIDAGKNVLCEKPLAPTKEQAEELFKAAEAKGVILMEAFAYLHTPYIKALKEEVDAGTIGDIKYIETAFLTSDYDISNIRMRRETYGGSLYDLGCYCTSMITWLLGKEPETVMAFAEFSEEKIDKFASAMLKYEGDVRAAFSSGMILETNKDRRHDRLYINGTKGYIKSDVEYNQAGELSYRICVDGIETVKTVSVAQNYSLEVAQLGRCITDGEKPHVSKEFTLMNASVLGRVLDAAGYV